MGVTVEVKGNWRNTIKFLSDLKVSSSKLRSVLEECGREGVAALSAATPVESSLTASSWDYEIHSTANGYQIDWINTNLHEGVPIAIILQYGHGTGTGGYVEGRDYINPAIRPIFDKLADKAWKAVNS